MQHHPEADAVAGILHIKARIHTNLGQHIPAVATLRQADEIFAAADRKGLVNAAGQTIWRQIVGNVGSIYLDSHQTEAAKRCYLRILNWPRVTKADRLGALQGMARYHKERKEWAKMVTCCQEAPRDSAECQGGLTDRADGRTATALARGRRRSTRRFSPRL